MSRSARPSRLRGALVAGALAALAASLPAAASQAPADAPAPAACTIRFPQAQTIAAGLRILPVHARLGATWTAGPSGVVQLGLGPAGSDPRTAAGWEFVDAGFALRAGDEDEYEASLTAPAVPGEYAYEYRVSLDGGAGFAYCGTEDGRPGRLTVTAGADTAPPALDLPDEVVAEATGSEGAEVAYDATAADAADGAVPATCAPATGARFPLGATSVECSATDAAGNVATGGFPVRVRDTTAPALDLPPSLRLEATGPGGTVAAYRASAADAVDGEVVPACFPEAGLLLPLGRTTVTCAARDRAGNAATGAFDVEVADTTPPAIAVPGDPTVAAASEAGAQVAYDATAADAVDGPVPVACVPASGDLLPVGATTVSCRAVDGRGNAATATFTATVTPYGPLPAVAVADGRALEGPDGTTALEVGLRLSAPAGPGGATVHLATADGTAVAGEDYVATAAAVHIGGGADSATATVPVLGDRVAEPDETFTVAVTGAEGARVGRGDAVATILDDDRPPPAVSVDDAQVAEGDSGATGLVFPVRLSATSPEDVTVGWSTRPGTAIYGDANDLLPAGGTVTIPAGRTGAKIVVPVAGDSLPELDETFTVALTDPAGAAIDRSTATGTIVDDDDGAPCTDAEGDGGDHPYALAADGAPWVRSGGHTLCAGGDRDFIRPEGLAAPPSGPVDMWVEVTIRGTAPGARTRVALPGAAAVLRGDGTVYVEAPRAGRPFLVAIDGAGGAYDLTAGLAFAG